MNNGQKTRRRLALAYINKNAQENLFYEGENRWGNTVNPRHVQEAAKELLLAVSQGKQKVLPSYSIKKSRYIKLTWNIHLRIVEVFPLTQEESVIFLTVFLRWMDRKVKEYDKKKKEETVRSLLERQKREEGRKKALMTRSQAQSLLRRLVLWSSGRRHNEDSEIDYVEEARIIVRKFLKNIQNGNSVKDFEYRSHLRENDDGLWDLHLNGHDLNVELDLEDLPREDMIHVLEELLRMLED